MRPSSVSYVFLRRLPKFPLPSAPFLTLVALGLGFLAVFLPVALRAQATAPAVSLGSVAVGSSGTGTVTFTFSASTTISSVSVVTQGATGLDFQPGTATTGACAAGTYMANATCKVAVNFTPLAAGLRSGAALLVDGSGNTVGVGYVSGSGTGATFETDNTAATQLINNDYPSQIIPDAAGNLYVGQLQTGSAVKLTPAGVKTSIAGASNNPYSIAVDGAGYIYIFDGLSDILYRTDPSSGTQTTFMSGLAYGFGLATDPLGNVYVGQGGSAASGTILKYSSSGTLLATINVPASPTAIISDASGNLYYTVYMGGLYTIAAGGTTSALVSTPPSYDYVSLAFDAAGNLYIAADGNVLYEMPAGTHTLNAIVTDSSMSTFILGVGVDGTGNLFYGKNGSLYKVDRTHPTASLSGTTVIGSSSTEKTVSYRNIGSAASAISAITASANGKVGPSNTCSAATPVAINATCVASLQFAPVAQGSPQNATLTLTGPLTAPVFTLTGDVAGDPTQLGFTSGPPPTLISGSSPGTVTVAIQDNSGSTILGLTDSLTLTITGPASPPPMTVSAVNGVATFNLSATSLITVGTYTFTASDNTRSLTSGMTTEAVLPKYFTVAPGSLNPIVTAPDTMTVTAYDNAGNLATAYTGYVALTSTDAAATLPAAFALSSGQGTASVTFRTIGGQTVTARDLVTGLITGTSSSIQVRAVPSYIVTTGTDDNGSAQATNCSDQSLSGATHDASCSLRDAIAATNALSFTGTTNVVPSIGFALSGGNVMLAAALNPTANVNIAGPGAALLTIAPTTNYTYNAFKSTANSIAFTLSGVTVTGFGGASPGAALYFSPVGSSATYADLVTLSNDTFSNNGGAPGGTTASSSGGAVYEAYSTLAITGSAFTGNSANNGGAIFVTSAPSVTITGSTFGASGTPNRALFTSGGAVYLNVSPATIGTSTFAYNTSKTNGAGVSSNYPLTLNTDVFLNNAVSNPNSSGGAVYSSGALTVAGSTFNNNTAITNGGAISAAALLTVSGSSFSMNQAGSTATSNGGAVYVSSNTANSISNTNFLANRVITTGSFAYGGALYANVANLTNVLFSGNSTSASTNSSFGGAAYYNSAANSQLTGVTFTGNSTTGGATNQDGGAVYIAGAGTLHIYNSTVSGNSAKLGGGLYNGGNGVIYLYNSVVSGNSASNGNPDLDNGSNGGFAATFNDYANEGMTCSSSCTPMLSALGNYGGGTVGAPGYTTPVRVMLPLPGSPLLAAGTTTLLYAPTGLTSQVGTVICNGVATEPDARGCSYPRALTEAGSTQVDIGAAEANYSLSFVQQPTTTQPGSTVTPAPTVQLLESGVAGGDGVGNDQGSYAGGTLAITATPDAASTTTVTTTASGLESLSESFTPATASETLTVSALNGAATPVTVASATSNSFNVVGVPTVTGISPASGPTPGGGTVTITGTNLIGVTSVSFGSVAATNVTVVSATSVTVTIPAANATGTVDVTVTNSAGTSATSSVDQYTYVVSLGSFTVTGYSSPAVATEGGTVTVSAITATGAIYTGFTGTVTLTSSDPKATLPATYTFLSSDNGVHTFSVTLNTLGTQSITATSGSVSGAQTGIVVGGSVWTVNATGTVSKLGPGGAALAGPVGTSGAVSTLGGVAFDASGGAWSVTQGNNALDYVNAAGGSSTAFTGGALNAPVAVAIDGSGTIWVANSSGSAISSVSNNGTTSSTTQDASIGVASGIAIDSSGNVWVTNSKTNTVDEVIGVAAPIAPLANAVQNNTTGVKP